MSCSKAAHSVVNWRMRILWLALVCWSSSGCSPDRPQRQAVRGSVSFDGKPVSGVALVFAPMGEDQLGATTQGVDGHFSLQRKAGPSVGDYFVTLAVIEPDLEEYVQLRRAGERPLSSLKFPPRYSQLGTLRAAVKASDENVFTFDLKSR